MLKLKNIKKSYKTGNFIQKAVDDISINFRKNEFVSILGQSGSGKTTLLNIIGGLDKYDSGDMIINNQSTKTFKNKNWDSYRNNCVGFIFQSYNLIGHISVLDNVELALTLSGKNKNKRRKQALKALDKVGLKEHAHKKPNQLSGGQMQRVAIARALVNDPEIILADEPTGALDSKTSVQIMNLIKDISKDKLVIMVTHNPELAKEYSNRVIEIKDGKIISDTNPLKDGEDNSEIKIKKTSMSFLQALKLSFNNIKTKKGRTFITAFASSIGIIGIALILALSNGFNIQIDKFEEDTLSTLPVVIQKQSYDLNGGFNIAEEDNLKKYTKEEKIYSFDLNEQLHYVENDINEEFINYIDKLDKNLYTGITYGTNLGLNTVINNNEVYKSINLTEDFFELPENSGNSSDFISSFFDIIYGKLPQEKEDLLLIVDSKNRISKNLIEMLGFNDTDNITFDDIMNKEIKVILNNDYYKKINNYYIINQDLENAYNSKNSITLKFTGIIRGREDKDTVVGNNMGISYTESLANYIKENNRNSNIVIDQKKNDYNVLTGDKFSDNKEKQLMLDYFGDDSTPSYIYIYPKNFDAKNEITDYLDKYNDKKKDEEKIIYTDQAKLITSLSSSIMDAITIVLIAFSSISLIVSSIMIGIITYISVLERTKEIGVLRSLGARGKDISRVFTAEVFITGLSSGLLGLLIARLLCIPANIIIENLTELPNVARLNIVHALILLFISIILTLIGGFIPARIASKKDPVEALRTE